MSNVTVHIIKAFTINILMLLLGYLLGGKTGLTIAVAICLLIQLL